MQNVQPVDAKVESYFVPKDQQAIRDRLFQLLDNAQNQVILAMYWITDDEILKKLIEIRDKNKKLNMQIIIDESMSQYIDLDDLIDTLLNHNIAPIIYASNAPDAAGKMHNKILIIDSTYVLTGSANFTKSAFDPSIQSYNFENVIVINSRNIAQKFKTDFFSIKKAIFEFYIEYAIDYGTNKMPKWWRRLLPHLYIKNPDFAKMVDEEIEQLESENQSKMQRLFGIKKAPNIARPKREPISDYQRNILEREGIPTEGMTYDEAYGIVGRIRQQQQGQPQQRQQQRVRPGWSW